MKRYVKILSARDMAPFGAIVPIALTLPGTTALVVFIALGHFLAWHGQGWEMLSWGWDPHIVSPSSGLAYLCFLILSVLAHEAGHLAVAAYRGDMYAGMYLGLNSWAPVFMTARGSRRTTSVPGRREMPALDLAGVSSQILFASSLGFIFILTGSYLIPPSILLIDVAATASLLPVPGTDGYRFILKSRMIKDRLGKNANGPGTYVIIGLCIFVIYSSLSLALLASVINQWLRGTTEGVLIWNYSILKTAGYIILLLPVLQYAYWAVRGVPSVITSLQRL
ncbi:MAG TPA: hypothetical protein VN455_13665 [Methanotrichaceae archaeon]|nr:hypothetical protein [Methanotrichaceae archaeon]